MLKLSHKNIPENTMTVTKVNEHYKHNVKLCVTYQDMLIWSTLTSTASVVNYFHSIPRQTMLLKKTRQLIKNKTPAQITKDCLIFLH